MKRRATWCGAAAVLGLGTLLLSCGGTGGGSGHHGNPDEQFVLNSNNAGRLVLTVDPTQVNANDSDRLGLVATLTDSLGHPIEGTTIVFVSDVDDITFIPGQVVAGRNLGVAVTDAHGNADIIAVAGASPTSTGAIIGTAGFFAEPPPAFGLRAQTQVTLTDIGFVAGDTLLVIPSGANLTEPAPGAVLFFNIVGGKPPYNLLNESSGIGTATLAQHCAPGCTEGDGVQCVGSPCQSDVDCGAGSPTGTCIGPIKRCLASCRGSNCAGSRCFTDADCNDGASSPANVCKDSGQSIAYIIGTGDIPAGTHGFTVTDSSGQSVVVDVNVTFICGNGVARGSEQCDLGDLRMQTCQSLGFVGGGTLLCDDTCKFDTSNCQAVAPTPGGSPGAATPTPGGGGTPTESPTPTPTVSPTSTATPGAPANFALSLLADCAGLNADTTLTTVIAAVVTDSNSNPVADNTSVAFSITSASNGASIDSPALTNNNAPCNVANFQAQCNIPVANQHGVAHTCITYPNGQQGTMRTVHGDSGGAMDSQVILLPGPPTPTVTPTP